MDIGAWLKDLRLSQYEKAFLNNAIDPDVLPTLTTDSLKDLGITAVGHRRKLLSAIAQLNLTVQPAVTLVLLGSQLQSILSDGRLPFFSPIWSATRV